MIFVRHAGHGWPEAQRLSIGDPQDHWTRSGLEQEMDAFRDYLEQPAFHRNRNDPDERQKVAHHFKSDHLCALNRNRRNWNRRCGSDLRRDDLDKLKIFERLAAYTLTIDGKDADGWANCFTEDGIFGQGDKAIRGRDNLRTYAEIHGNALGSRHTTTSPYYHIDENGKTATGRSTTVVTVATPTGYKIAMTGLYADELKKIGQDWLIARRWVTVEGLPHDPDYFMLAADAELAARIQPLLDAWRRLSG